MATTDFLLTAEQFAALPDTFGGPVELVKGEIVKMNVPAPRHGLLCARIVYHLFSYLDQHAIGRVTCNDSGVITERNPDTVRGADVAYYSHERVPPGPFPAGYLEVAPELVFEIHSPSDRWSAAHAKIADYLGAGVQSVCVLDDRTRAMHVFHADRPAQNLSEDEELTLPEILPGFAVRVGKFLE